MNALKPQYLEHKILKNGLEKMVREIQVSKVSVTIPGSLKNQQAWAS